MEMALGHRGDRNPGWPDPRAGPTGVSVPASLARVLTAAAVTETRTAQSWHGSERPTPVRPESSVVSLPELSSYVSPPRTPAAGGILPASHSSSPASPEPRRVGLGSLTWKAEKATESSAPRVFRGTPATRRGPRSRRAGRHCPLRGSAPQCWSLTRKPAHFQAALLKSSSPLQVTRNSFPGNFPLPTWPPLFPLL